MLTRGLTRALGRASGLAALVLALVLVTACSGASHPGVPAPTSGSPSAGRPTASSAPAPTATVSVRAGATAFNCDNPIGQLVAPSRPQVPVLDAVALDTTTKSLQADDAGGNAPYRLFAKTALMVHAGSAAEIDVPARWAKRASVTWGDHAPQWTGQLVIPACPSDGPGGDWLVYPGGVSVDRPSCVPLDVHAGDAVVTVRVSVGAPC